MGALTNPLELAQFDELPAGLTEVLPENLYRILPCPTLVHLTGRKPQPLFVSVLLHGNEPTGFLAIQELLREYRSKPLPRSMSIFFGNVLAAKEQVRRLDSQPDFNRIWPGAEEPESQATRFAENIVDELLGRNVFASIDIHNNTGLNPHYACVNVFDDRYLQLARLFSRLVVYFIRPRGVLSAAFGRHCPSVTLECGKPGQQYGVSHALEYLTSCLHLTEIPERPVQPGDLDLFHSIAQVTIPETIQFDFSPRPADLELSVDIDHMNFTEVPEGTIIGKIRTPGKIPLLARDELGLDVTSRYFRIENQDLVLNRAIMPSMFTLDHNVIRQDCLGYIMERIHSIPETHNP
ncbi:MAG: M14 family metallopeptidase [Methylococcaceae bacterium]|nr:M14 family metallopeptidase [Methylococcaceae bacterium]